MREDSADKSAREGLREYAPPLASEAARVKACGCPAIGCTVECRRRQEHDDEPQGTFVVEW